MTSPAEDSGKIQRIDQRISYCDRCKKRAWGHLIKEEMYFPKFHKKEYRSFMVCHECYMAMKFTEIQKEKSVMKY